MAWSKFTITYEKGSLKRPQAGVKLGRLELNAAAFALIDQAEDCSYAEFFLDPEQPTLIQIRFTAEESPDAVPINRRMLDGRMLGGVDIRSHLYTEALFGAAAKGKSFTHYPVYKDESADRTLVINIGPSNGA